MANDNKSNVWQWLVVAIIVATVAVGVLFYIGWFDNRTHVDSPNGDNVTQTYQNNDPQPNAPGEAEWQNLDAKNLKQEVVDPSHPTATPPQGE